MTDLSYTEAMADVRARVEASKTSFAVGMGLLPKTGREGIYALYAFCREVDDIADDSPTPEIRKEGLKLWRERIRALFQEGRPSDSITTALSPAIERFGLVEEDFQAIIAGMEMDAEQTICAPPLAELDSYCDHVASAVGRVSVRLFGDSSEMAMRVAHHLGRALQLTNILRDLSEDAQRGRLYLPVETLEIAGIETRVPSEVLAHPKLRIACRALAHDAQDHFDEAIKAMKASHWQAMRPARAMGAYYHAILVRLLKEDWKDPTKRVSLPAWQKILIALRSLVG